jgi:ATP-dependent 26S proteasome regulatory subunit
VLIRVGLPQLADRAEVLRVHTARMPLAPENDLQALAARADGLSAADLAQLCVQVILFYFIII